MTEQIKEIQREMLQITARALKRQEAAIADRAKYQDLAKQLDDLQIEQLREEFTPLVGVPGAVAVTRNQDGRKTSPIGKPSMMTEIRRTHAVVDVGDATVRIVRLTDLEKVPA